MMILSVRLTTQNLLFRLEGFDMIKKFLTIFIMLSLSIQTAVFAREGRPAFVFAIDDYFDDSSTSNSGGGLSGGAVTAITLGSIGGAALLGLGGWLYKRKTEQCLAAGCIRGAGNPIVPFCMETNPNAEIYARINNNYPYLKKALSLNEIHYCPNSKYLLVYDTPIEKRKFDSVKFEIPQGTKALKITHVTDSFARKDVTAELFLYKNETNTTEPYMAELENISEKSSEKNGIIMKTLSMDFQNYPYAAYVVSNYSDKKIYAVVIEFIFQS